MRGLKTASESASLRLSQSSKSSLCAQVQTLCLSAAFATFALLKVGSVAHQLTHKKGREDKDAARYRQLLESVPAELWDIAARIKAQRGVCQV